MCENSTWHHHVFKVKKKNFTEPTGTWGEASPSITLTFSTTKPLDTDTNLKGAAPCARQSPQYRRGGQSIITSADPRQ